MINKLEWDRLVDRRLLKRRLAFWRVLALVGLVSAGLALWARFGDGQTGGTDHIARLWVDDIIFEDSFRLEVLQDLEDDDSAKAVIIRIDSPGGTVVGGETLYKALLRLGEKRPVVAVMGEMATSAGYMVAIAADRVYAHEGTLTGSIGVILQTADITGLLDKLGIKPETVKSAPLKAVPNPMEPFTDAAREVTRASVLDSFDLFKEMVMTRRRFDAQTLAPLADGRVFTGRQALKAGLVDALGGEREALDWLAAEKGVDLGLPVRDLETMTPEDRFLDLLDGLVGKAFVSETLNLDGLISLWHPGLR
ncbi:MAG: signal peptide peptidase SppA [Rhodospirillales bacterium]